MTDVEMMEKTVKEIYQSVFSAYSKALVESDRAFNKLYACHKSGDDNGESFYSSKYCKLEAAVRKLAETLEAFAFE